jgi:ligand-binding sensor domain-containing protein
VKSTRAFLLLLALSACKPLTEEEIPVVGTDEPWRPPSQVFTQASTGFGLPSNSVRTVLVDFNNHVWAGTGQAHLSRESGAGLARFDGQSWKTYDANNSPLPSLQIVDLAQAPDSSLWVAGTTGLARFKNDTWQTFTAAAGTLPVPNVTAIAVDQRGTVWLIGSDPLRTSIFSFDGRTWQRETDPVLTFTHAVTDLLIDRQNRFWVGTLRDGLFRKDASGWQNFRQNNSGLPTESAATLHEDAEGRIWIATNYGPLASSSTGPLTRFDGQKWETFNYGRAASDRFESFSVTTDRQGKVWVASIQGLLRYDGTWRLASIPEAGITYQLTTDRTGTIWAATSLGLVRITPP